MRGALLVHLFLIKILTNIDQGSIIKKIDHLKTVTERVVYSERAKRAGDGESPVSGRLI